MTIKAHQYIDDNGEIQQGVFLRTPYNYDRHEESKNSGTACPEEEDVTQQHFKEECDINVILEKFGVTGELPMNVRQPISQDFVEAIDFQSAQNAIRAAEESFMAMDAKTRARFDNDPQKFITFFEDENNRAEGERLGLVNARPEPKKEPPAGAGEPKTPQVP